jgi:hypothetical protein
MVMDVGLIKNVKGRKRSNSTSRFCQEFVWRVCEIYGKLNSSLNAWKMYEYYIGLNKFNLHFVSVKT